jgi:hypothetical protein
MITNGGSGLSCINPFFPCANFESSRVRLELEASPAPTPDPGGDKASESECEGSAAEDGSAGLLSSLFISTTDATDVPPSDSVPEDDACDR